MSGEPSDDSAVLRAAADLPLAERLAHANWKVRSAALESARDSLAKIFNAEDPLLEELGARRRGGDGRGAQVPLPRCPRAPLAPRSFLTAAPAPRPRAPADRRPPAQGRG